jgi:hypothetical protein
MNPDLYLAEEIARLKRVTFLKRDKVKREVSFKAKGKKVSFKAKVPAKKRRRVSFLARERR